MRLRESLEAVANASPEAFEDLRRSIDPACLGAEPMEWLFGICADHWAHASARNHGWRGLAVYGVDGTTLRVPGSKDNARHFRYSHSVRGESAYPMVPVVALITLRSHLLSA